jgi:hypothetical protein
MSQCHSNPRFLASSFLTNEIIDHLASCIKKDLSCGLVSASDSQCRRRNCPGFHPNRHSGIRGAAAETVLNKILKKINKNPPLPLPILAFSRGLKITYKPLLFSTLSSTLHTRTAVQCKFLGYDV